MSAFEILRSRFDGTEAVVTMRENGGAQIDVSKLDMQSGLNIRDEIERILPGCIVGGTYPRFVITLRPKTQSVAPDMRK